MTQPLTRTEPSACISIQHGHTYLGHPACAGTLVVQEPIAKEQLLGRVRRQGTRLFELLDQTFGDHLHVGDTCFSGST